MPGGKRRRRHALVSIASSTPFLVLRFRACRVVSQMSALLSGLGGDQEWSGGEGRRGGPTGSSSTREIADIRTVLETATAALEEIRNQVFCIVLHCRPLGFRPASLTLKACVCGVLFYVALSAVERQTRAPSSSVVATVSRGVDGITVRGRHHLQAQPFCLKLGFARHYGGGILVMSNTFGFDHRALDDTTHRLIAQRCEERSVARTLL